MHSHANNSNLKKKKTGQQTSDCEPASSCIEMHMLLFPVPPKKLTAHTQFHLQWQDVQKTIFKKVKYAHYSRAPVFIYSKCIIH